MFKRQKTKGMGFTIPELMLVLCCIVIAGAFMYKAFTPTASQASVKKEQEQASVLVDTVFNSYSTAPNYASLTTETVAGLANLQLLGASPSGSAGRANSASNSSANSDVGTVGLPNTVRSVLTVRPATTTSANDSFEFVYSGIPTAECIGLSQALSNRSSGIYIAGKESVQSQRGKIDNEGLISQYCSSTGPTTTLVFRFTDNKHTFAATSMNSGMCSPTSEVQNLPCPAGSVGNITQRRTGACTGGTPDAPTLEWSSWTTVLNTCAASGGPVSPNAPVAPVDPNTCVPTLETQTIPCPAGQQGGQLQQRTKLCPQNTLGSWTTISSSCSPSVVVKSCSPSNQRQTVACPAGQGGQETQERVSTCSASGDEVWGDWKLVNSTCTASCVADGTCCRVSREERPVTGACPVGSYGTQSGTEFRTSTCPTATSTPTWPSVWQNKGMSGSCTTCPAPTTDTQRQSPTVSQECPAGQTGSHTWTSNQVRTRTVSYNCAVPLDVLPAPTNSSWTDWTEVSRTNEVNTCAVTATPGGDACTTFLPANACTPPNISVTPTLVTIGSMNGTATGGTKVERGTYPGTGAAEDYVVEFRDYTLTGSGNRDCRVNPTNGAQFSQTPQLNANFAAALSFNGQVKNFKLWCSISGHITNCTIARSDIPNRMAGEYSPNAASRSGRYESSGDQLVWFNGTKATMEAQTSINAWTTCDTTTGQYKGHADLRVKFVLPPYEGWCGAGAVQPKPTCYSWGQVEETYGPGSGCRMEPYPISYTDGVIREPWVGAAGSSFGLVGAYPWTGKNSGSYGAGNIDVNERWYPCTEANLGETIRVLSSCGSWQAGMEGWSGYQCN